MSVGKGRVLVFACNNASGNGANVTLESETGTLTVSRNQYELYQGYSTGLTRRFYEAEIADVSQGDKITFTSWYMPIIIIEKML